MNLRESTPVAFINVTERERALGFYRDVLGFTPSSADSFGDFIDMGQALIRMTVLPGYQPPQYPVCGWDVADIGDAVTVLAERGVAMTIYEGLGAGCAGHLDLAREWLESRLFQRQRGQCAVADAALSVTR